MTAWKNQILLYRHKEKHFRLQRIYLEVVTYGNDGHFYYKIFTADTRYDFKLRKIHKADLLNLLQDYEQVNCID